MRRLRAGFEADVTVFDPAGIGSPASYDQPDVPPTGVHLVIRGGRVIHRSEPIRPPLRSS